MKIDLHNHTTLSSDCSVLNPVDLIKQAMRLGLDAICVTEHNTVCGGKEAERLGRDMGFLVIAAQEVTTREGDVLAFGIEESGLYGISVAELYQLALSNDGCLVAAHPFRAFGNSVRQALFQYPDSFTAVEGFNGNCSDNENQKAQKAAQKLNIPVIASSDAHSVGQVARYYTEFEDEITDIRSLIAALRSARFKPCANPLWTGR